jgi:putative peptidoglycan lipid II flippase
MKKTSVILIVIVIITKIVSVIKDMTLANYYGISKVTDVYVVSITISTLFFAFFLSAIKSSFIPKYSEILKNESEGNANEFANSILTLIILVMIVLIGLVLIFTKQIVNVIAPGFDKELVDLTIYFTRISIFSILFTAIFSVFSGLLNINNIFLAPAVAVIPMQIVLIFTIIISSNSSIYLLPWGYVFASIIHLLFILPLLRKIKFRYKPKINFDDIHTKSFLVTIIPIFLSVALSDLSKIIDKALASTFHIGAISTLEYAHKLTGIVESIGVLSILTVIFPTLSKFAYSDIEKYKSKFIETFKLISLIAVPSMVGFMLMNLEFVDLVYGRGEFDTRAVFITARVLMFYSPTILFFSLRALYIRSF